MEVSHEQHKTAPSAMKKALRACEKAVVNPYAASQHR